MKPQLAVSYPGKINRHQFGGDCQVTMAEGGEKCDQNVVDEDLEVKSNSTSAIWTYMDSGETTCYKHRYCVKHAEQLLQLLEEIQPTTCNTTIKTYTNNLKLTLAIINCIVNNMQTSIFVYLSQVILSTQYWTVLSHVADFPHIVQSYLEVSNDSDVIRKGCHDLECKSAI